MSPKLLRYAGVVLVGLAAGGLIGYGFGHKATTNATSQVLRENSSTYKFVNPLLLTQSNSSTKAPQYEGIRSAAASYIKNAVAAGKASDISLYVRDMNSGLWTGVNEDATYAPGSMLKVPIMLGYLDKSEEVPAFLDEKYYYNPQIDEGQYFKPARMLSQGTYAARDLIKNMIIESDNTATIILANAHPEEVAKVYENLALPNPEAGADFMSPKQYASFWRVLYNGTYLSHDVSEEALDLLSLTTFDDGLIASLPKGVRVSHKFGEHTNVAPGIAPVHELHDCGIVYPDKTDPYFICVMTRGSDFMSLETVISDISKMVFENLPK